MKKQSIPVNQMSLFPEHNPLLDLDGRVRTIEIGGEVYASILDIFQYHGNKTNPTLSWQQTLRMLEKQGFDSSMDFIEHQFKGRGQKKTPIINLNGFLRIVQSSEVKEWESIRVWLAKTGADVIRNKATREREKNIHLHNEAGLGDTPEARRYAARHESIETYKRLSALINRICENPQFAKLTNAEYLGIFGETTESLKEILHTKSIRGSLTTIQIRTLTYAEDILRDILAEKRQVTNEEIVLTIKRVYPPIGNTLKEIMNSQGLDHITGEVLPSGAVMSIRGRTGNYYELEDML